MPAWSLGVECPYQMENGQSDRRNPHPTHTMVISSSLMQQNIGAEEEKEYRAIGYCGARISSGKLPCVFKPPKLGLIPIGSSNWRGETGRERGDVVGLPGQSIPRRTLF